MGRAPFNGTVHSDQAADQSTKPRCIARYILNLRRRSLIAFRTVAAILEPLSFYFRTEVTGTFDSVVERSIAALKEHGFGALTDIDIKQTLKQKLGVDFRQYRILVACNPPLAHRALNAEDKVGTMLPCNLIVQDLGGGRIEVAAIDPRAGMQQVANPELNVIASEVAAKLQLVIEQI